ncbi:uncharacterized protein LOC129612274 [Condylostylus longicornis]|uniref:uncharacterized protein LOC129612274 n=1 Tax=Condylostylus longicornis TaxID=2530218 RepID=UPI00244DA866|nr:uncharacterized protein LOC129612274 [Condylostylus longicornis]
MPDADRFVSQRYWERSSSEPDLTDTHNLHDRFRIKNPHEYIAVDDLKYFRRKKPLDFHTKSNICLFDKDEPVLPFSSLKSEYRWRYKNPLLFGRSGLMRKSTSLKLQGQMQIETEHKSKYLPFSEEEISSCRVRSLRSPQNLRLEGDIELSPEYKSSFVPFPKFERQRKYTPVEKFKIHGDIEMTKTPIDINSDDIPETETKIAPLNENKIQSQKCHLKLEGSMNCVPEYRSQYIPYHVEKSHSIPQLSNIHFNGTFYGIPEYKENYKFYEDYSKSVPIRHSDHLKLHGQLSTQPEYKDQYKEIPENIKEKTESSKIDDHLKPEGKFSRDVPEYYESFKDPQIKTIPERGKCREPYFRLKGKIEFNPEYRSTYLDYPRSRPITKKAQSTLRISNSSKSPFETPSKRFQSKSPGPKYHDPNDNLPVTQKPEYRKANFHYQIRERTPKDHKGLTTTTATATASHQEIDTRSQISAASTKRPPRRREPTFIDNSDSSSTNKENLTKNIEILSDEPSTKPIPKYGRRASVARNAQNIREKSSIIEGNPKYFKDQSSDDSQLPPQTTNAIVPAEDSSFVVLDDACRENNWMKKSWYEP